ncbi:syntaxin-121 [Cornus florida]|uniref:syntaxin-121 n=1 Tax=Cornus florida TaxID=4283 RepID=UPI00289BE027|nr:syntaxin-121 [Cornus florida]
MNDLLANSFSPSPQRPSGEVELSDSSATGAGVNLDEFFKDVEAIKHELRDVETLYKNLQTAHEQSKTLHNAKSVKDLRSRMDNDVTSSLKKAKLIKTRLESLDRSNADSRRLPGCGPGSSSDRTRTSVVNGLRKKLQDSMNSFNSLRQQIATEYRDTVQRRYYTVTGKNAEEAVIDRLISTGESETFLATAIQEQGRGKVIETVMEIQERHEAVKEIERNLKELNQVFMDMAVLVQAQGEELDDIESQVARANSYVRGGTQQLHKAKRLQINSRKWSCYGIILLLIIILFIVLFVVKPWN